LSAAVQSMAFARGFGGKGLVLSSLFAVADAADSTAFTCKHLKDNYKSQTCCGAPDKQVPLQVVPKPSLTGNLIVTQNPCAGAQADKADWPNVECLNDALEQAGGDVTAGFEGQFDTDIVPIQQPYHQGAAGDLHMGPLCPVNVHWHLGAEHRSEGQFDENGKSPMLAGTPNQPYTAPPLEGGRRLGSNATSDRRLVWTNETNDRRLGANVRYGFACHHYDAADPKFTTAYNWQHCIGMHVGETYEVHWPHSALGACNTAYQYQSKFYDGIFCRYDPVTHAGLTPQNIASAVGVQSQTFTIVNDEAYYYPNLMKGMIVTDSDDSDFGKDMAIYSGSSTGTSRDNSVCSAYSPITWQVDRKCHLISASSFDKMCADMKHNFDDMSMDLHAHGARGLVDEELTANNMVDATHQTR